MAVNLTWPKTTLLTVGQAAAAAVLSALGGNATNVLDLNWEQLAGLGAGAGLVAFLGLVVAYKIPSQGGTALISVPAAAQNLLPDPEPVLGVHDADGAR